MNKIFDGGYEDNFFTQDIKGLMDINKGKSMYLE